MTSSPPPLLEVAIVGYGLRFPGGINSGSAFWDLLVRRGCVTAPVPTAKWSSDRFITRAPRPLASSITDQPLQTSLFSPSLALSNSTDEKTVPSTTGDTRLPATIASVKMGLVPNSDRFDPSFFNIAAADAIAMDPQQRMFLCCVVDALEQARIPLQSLRGTDTGVWVGASVMEYLAAQAGAFGAITPHSNPGIALCVIANRVSFFLGLRGPSMAVDTACASSITALDLACQAIRSGRCSVAIVGGTNNTMMPDLGIGYTQMGVVAPDGQSKSFDARADGYARAEGYGCVVLKRLDAALEDGNLVLSLVRACRSNANGDLSTGLTKPSAEAQAILIRQTWEDARLPLSAVDYVEAHGTGTSVGDPIEARGIGETFGKASLEAGRPAVKLCSVKGNLGHMEPAAGMASLIKACLMIQHRSTCPQALFSKGHPDIDWKGWHLSVPVELETLKDLRNPMTIAINAFGFGGSNSHAILQAPPELRISTPAQHTFVPHWCFDATSELPNNLGTGRRASFPDSSTANVVGVPFSAHNLDALHQLVLQWSQVSISLYSAVEVIASTCLRRMILPCRAVILASSAAGFCSAAAAFGKRLPVVNEYTVISGKTQTFTLPICLVFSGQGSQYSDMGVHLFATYPVFRDTILKCDHLYQKFGGRSFLQTTGLFRNDPIHVVDLDRPDFAQPCICFFQIAMFELLKFAGIHAEVVVGHSVGEVAAAYASGHLSLEQAVHLIEVRSRQQQRTENRGGMLAMAASLSRVEAILRARGFSDIVVAAINGPNSITVAGPTEEIQELRHLCKHTYGIQSSVLGVRCAYHSWQMDAIRTDLTAALSFLEAPRGAEEKKLPQSPPALMTSTVRLFSSTTGTVVPSTTVLGAEYWWNNVRGVVRFQEAIESILRHSPTVSPSPPASERPNTDSSKFFIEIAPRTTLISMIQQICAQKRCAESQAYCVCEKGVPESHQFWHLLARCHILGYPLHWNALLGWDASKASKPQSLAIEVPNYPFRETDSYIKMNPTYCRAIHGSTQDAWRVNGGFVDTAAFPWILDHSVGGNVLVPASAFIEFVLETVSLPTPTLGVLLSDIKIVRALPFPVTSSDGVHVAVISPSSGVYEVVTGFGGDKGSCVSSSCTAQSPIVESSARTVHCTLRVHQIEKATDNGFETERSGSLNFLGFRNLHNLRLRLNDPNSVGFRPVPKQEFYKKCEELGYSFGPAHALVSEMWLGDEQVIYVVNNRRSAAGGGFRFHPCVMDACVHGVIACLGFWSKVVVPVSIAELRIIQTLPITDELLIHARAVRRWSDGGVEFDLCVVDPVSWVTFPFARDDKKDAPGENRRDVLMLMAGLKFSPLTGSYSTTNPRLPSDTLLEMRWQNKYPPHELLQASLTCSLSSDCRVQLDLEIATLRDALSDLRLYVATQSQLFLEHYAISLISGMSGAPSNSPFLASLRRFAEIPDLPDTLTHLSQAANASQLPLPFTSNVVTGPPPERAALNSLMRSLHHRLPFFEVELDIIKTVCEHFPDIVSDSSVIGELIYKPELLPRFFRTSFTVNALYQAVASRVVSMVDVLCKQGRSVRILEVGLRTGGLTSVIAGQLQTLAAKDMIQYHATDLGETFFSEAAAQLKPFPWVQMKRFNIEMDATQQSLEPHSYDIVIIMSTLHGVANLSHAMHQIDQILVPGGVVMNIEPCESSLWWLMELWFGSMHVWWRFADQRLNPNQYLPHGRTYATCWMSQQEWMQLFREHGFSDVSDVSDAPRTLLFSTLVARKPVPVLASADGLTSVDLDIIENKTAAKKKRKKKKTKSVNQNQHQNQNQSEKKDQTRLIETSTLQSAPSQVYASNQVEFLVLTNNRSRLNEETLVSCLQKQLSSDFGRALFFLVNRADVLQVLDQALSVAKSMNRLHIVYYLTFANAKADDALPFYVAARRLACYISQYPRNISPSLSFVSEGAGGESCSQPLGAFFQGFTRAAGYELPHCLVRWVDLDPAPDATRRNCMALASHLSGTNGRESEVILRQGQCLVPRLHRVKRLQDGETLMASINAFPFVRLESSDSGALDDVKLCGSFAPLRPATDETEVIVEWAALNFKDVLLSLGMLTGLSRSVTQSLGFGFVGRIAPAAQTSDKKGKSRMFPPGQRVICLAGACFASRAICKESLMVSVPPSCGAPFRTLGCVTMYATAWEACVERARIQKGDIILIHSATSGVGQCAIQLARHFKARIIATAGTAAKRDWLRKELSIECVTDSRNLSSFVQDVRKWTSSKGVDIVLNSLSGALQRASLNLLRPGGRFIEIGKRDLLSDSPLPSKSLLPNISFISCQLDLMAEDQPHKIAPLLTSVLKAFDQKIFSPIATREVLLTEDEFRSALRLASRGDSIQKVVFNVEQGLSSLAFVSNSLDSSRGASNSMSPSGVSSSILPNSRSQYSNTQVAQLQANTSLHQQRPPHDEKKADNGSYLPPQFNGLVHVPRLIPVARRFESHGSYVITGGLGGIGLALAAALASAGAGCIVLLTRGESTSITQWQKNHITTVSEMGTIVLVKQCDVSNPAAVTALVAELTKKKSTPYQLRGVFHLAAALEDGLISNLDDERFLVPIRSKAVGAFNLHEATKEIPLDVFLVSTSTQDLFGVEQSNYVAADLIIQQLILYRRHCLGLKGTVVALGPVLGAGMVERDRRVARILQSRGAGFVDVAEVVSAFLESALSDWMSSAYLPPFFMMARIDGALCDPNVPVSAGNLKWQHLVRSDDCSSCVPESIEERLGLVRKKIGEIFCLSPGDVDPQASLLSFGVDSLIVTELLNFLKSKLKVDLSYTDILSGITTTQIVERATLSLSS